MGRKNIPEEEGRPFRLKNHGLWENSEKKNMRAVFKYFKENKIRLVL